MNETDEQAEIDRQEGVAAAAAAQQDAITQSNSVTFRNARAGKPTAVMPGGIRIDASPFMQTRYTLRNQTVVMGAPETLIKRDAQRPGWHYVWARRTGREEEANRTAAYIRSGVYHPVEWDELDKMNPLAQVTELTTPAGKHVILGQLILVRVSPEVWADLYQAPEHQAIQKVAMNRQTSEAELNDRFGGGGFRGQVDDFVDQRRSKTGD